MAFTSQSFLSIDIQGILSSLGNSDELANPKEVSTIITAAHQSLQLAASSQARDPSGFRSFLKCITHEMRTPLNPVIAHNTVLVESGAVQGEPLVSAAEALAMAEMMLCQVFYT